MLANEALYALAFFNEEPPPSAILGQSIKYASAFQAALPGPFTCVSALRFHQSNFAVALESILAAL